METKIKNSVLRKFGITAGAIWGLWIAAAGILYLLVFGPQEILMAKLQKECNVSGEQYILAQTAGREQTRIRVDEELRVIQEKASGFLVAPSERTTLMFQISQLATQRGLSNFSTRVREFSTSFDENDNPKITEGWLELSFSSSFQQYAAFMNDLERNRPVVFIETAQISRELQSQQEPDAQILISYLVAESPETTKPATTN